MGRKKRKEKKNVFSGSFLTAKKKKNEIAALFFE